MSQLRSPMADQQEAIQTDFTTVPPADRDVQSDHVRALHLFIPLYFVKYRLSISLNRDRRPSTLAKEAAREFLGAVLGRLFLLYLALVIFLPIIFLILYVIKSALGIDIFPDRHLSDFLPF